ncbi:MAG: hypothetical protein IT355_03920 [Gemmatimonadaceae bacterium]|nr:hypothetical protein [Gemmatimonadaceae bacterium]
MSDEQLHSPVLPSVNPAEAYAADMARLQRTTPIGPSDDAWLVLAHALTRFSELSAAELSQTIPHAADMLAVSAVAMGLASESTVLRAARALRSLHDPRIQLATGYDSITEVVVSTQAVAEDQEVAGALGLAYATLTALLSAFGPRIRPRMQGNVFAQLGRAARQLGANDIARDMYEEAMVVGYESESLDVVARAVLGLGVMALTRGNYPKARELFERGLMNADRAKDPELIRSAHHGLLNCGLASGDLDSAMVHGWNVLRLCIAPDSRAEALMNMAEICRLTGEHDAAMKVYAVAMEWTSQRRVRLHAASGALLSAATSGRSAEAARYRALLHELLPAEPDPYTRAVIGLEFADSLRRLGEAAAAGAQLSAARALAAEHEFHELLHRAEAAEHNTDVAPTKVEATRRATRRTRAYRSEHFRMVLHSLNGLTAASL